jgi:protein kinase X
MSIHDVFRLKQTEHVKNEKQILESIESNNPFLVRIVWSHHDSQYLYMLLEYVPGGELFSLLRQRNKFETKAAIFYSAEIVCALEYLHSMQIAYRDLKPENILLDVEGHLKLTDFGFAKVVTNKTYTLCGKLKYE